MSPDLSFSAIARIVGTLKVSGADALTVSAFSQEMRWLEDDLAAVLQEAQQAGYMASGPDGWMLTEQGIRLADATLDAVATTRSHAGIRTYRHFVEYLPTGKEQLD